MIKAGSVAYIFACSPIEAKLRTENLVSCTNEIPITIGNSTEAFADPVSLVIMKNSTRTVCSSISPVKWAIATNNRTEWYCSTPKITRCTHPQTLDPMIIKANPYQVRTSALNLDLYDKEQMKAMDRFLQISNARKSLISDFAYQLTANPGKSTGRVILDSLTSTDSESLRTLILPNTFRVFCDVWEKAKNWILTILVLKAIFNITRISWPYGPFHSRSCGGLLGGPLAHLLGLLPISCAFLFFHWGKKCDIRTDGHYSN